MEHKQYDNSIILDGRMDEPIWETAKEYGGFCKTIRSSFGGVVGTPEGEDATTFKILTFADRVFFGVKCMKRNMQWLIDSPALSWGPAAGIELLLSPSGNTYDFYQFYVSAKGDTGAKFYDENGNIQPDRFAPDWKSAVYYGENYWSVEVEFPLTAFYMTTAARWSDTWLVNVTRGHRGPDGKFSSTWSPEVRSFKDSVNYRALDGFPIRAECDDIYISNAQVSISGQDSDGYYGTMKISVRNTKADTFAFSTGYGESVTVELAAGENEFAVPCRFEKLIRYKVDLSLQRLTDGKVFKRYFPVLITYDPLVLKFTLPEYRTNFYPGQDASRIVGKAIAAEPVTLTLEGPGIPKQTIVADAEGNFVFETPNFEVGDAYLTATVTGYEVTKKIRHLAPSGNMMSWISGGNLIVDGRPTLSRRMSAVGYRGGEAFERRYKADDLRETRHIFKQSGHLQAGRLLPGSEAPGAEATVDGPLSEEMIRRVDATLEANKGKDFAFYYITDEPECRGISKIYLKNLYDYVTDKDPYHAVRLSTRNAAEYFDIADWFETHPYINPYTNHDGKRMYGRQINTVGDFIDVVTKRNRPDKCIGFLSTCYAAARTRTQPYPTFDETICHIWATMIRGAKTICSYAYHDMNDRGWLYEGCRYMFSSLERLEEMQLMAARTTLYKTKEVEAVLYTLGEKKMFVVVNMTNEAQTVTLDGISGTWHEFRHARTVSGNTFQLKPMETLIATSEVMDEGLPTYQETVALMEQLEYARTHTGSLFFERKGDIAVTTSSTASIGVKLFDGVRDNYAWGQSNDKEKFIELDLTKIKPAITKVSVYGHNVGDAELFAKNGEELIAPAVKEVITEEFSKTFVLEETISPDAIRMEFKAYSVEIYEIEAH